MELSSAGWTLVAASLAATAFAPAHRAAMVQPGAVSAGIAQIVADSRSLQDPGDGPDDGEAGWEDDGPVGEEPEGVGNGDSFEDDDDPDEDEDEDEEEEAPQSSLPPEAPPVAGRRLLAAPVSGTVLVRLPRTTGFELLEAPSALPVGATIDAAAGAVRLTAAGGTRAAPQRAVFSLGSFTLHQTARAKPVTVLKLDGTLDCAANASTAGARRRHLLGRGAGRFRTVGRSASATVRAGAKWLTEDRCGGTLVKVTRGSALVDPERAGKAVEVDAGRQRFVRDR